MATSTIPTAPSLLPYVAPGKAGLRLHLSGLQAQDGPAMEPLAAIEGTGPFAAIVEGAITAGGQRNTLADLFLLVQPDRYPAVSSELTPFANPDVEKLWQTAADRLRVLHPDGFPALLPEQIDADGQTVPWRSLFYCRHTRRYGHPLCPQCGGALTLCRDDRALEKAGLPGYTTSLSRFLHCPACHRHAETPLFYARFLPPDPPAHLCGADRLIEGFSRLLARQDLAHALPCVACDQETDCYGPQTLVHQRMLPLFFYPFHMLAQPAPSLNILEFLELLTGTAVDRIDFQLARRQKPGRLRKWRRCLAQLTSGDGLLFQQAHKRFGEVLYLKLSLLNALFDMVRPAAGHLSEPVAGMSLESIWVRLPAQATRLPYCWNFALQWVDGVGRPALEGVPGPLSRARAGTFLGTAWCHVLLVNENQNMQAVLSGVDAVLTASPELDTQNQESAEQAAPSWSAEPVFDAANLVGFALPSPIDGQWQHLWQRALGMGFDLLRAGHGADAAWCDERFGQQLDALRQAVHTALFQAAATPTADTTPVRQTDDAAIAVIVRSLLAQWPQEVPVSSATSDPLDADALAAGLWQQIPDSAEGDYQATVILGSEDAFDVQAPPDPTGTPELERTVMLDSGRHIEPGSGPHDDEQSRSGIAPGPAEADPPPQAVEEMEQTVILQPPSASTDRVDDLDATVMIDAKGSVTAAPRAPAPPKAPADDMDDLDDLAQTVILPPRGERKPRP